MADKQLFPPGVYIFFCLVLVSCGGGADRPIFMRIGHPMAPGNNVTLGYEKFAERAAEKSGGRITIKIYPNAVLGNDRAAMEAVQRGELEMASSSTPNMADLSPLFMVFDLPYITSPEHQEKLYKAIDGGALAEYFERAAADIRLKPVMWSEYGYRCFATVGRPLRKPGDIRGLRVRTTQSPIDIAVTEALGAFPVSLTWADTYPALIRGMIDGEGNTFNLLLTAKHHEALRFVTTTFHNYSMHVLMMNLDYWNGLPGEVRGLLREAAAEALAYERDISRGLEKKAGETFVRSGISVIEISHAERELWKLSCARVRNEYAAAVPPELIRLVQDTQD